MAEDRAEREREEAERGRVLREVKDQWRARGRPWLPMRKCPFAALDDEYGLDGTILVSDGKSRAIVTVSERFGTPIFWKEPPQQVIRDGIFYLIGGEKDPRPDLPEWWWEWELTDEHGTMTYAGGEETGKEEVDFVPTIWTFLPEPPEPE